MSTLTFEVTKQPSGEWSAILPQVERGTRLVQGWADVERLRHEWDAIDIWPGESLQAFVAEFGEHPATPR